ncbi:hypothetical protein BGW80DRAFT_1465156 [Lactifluus volemus]|nr:hypothetical protein BGW80DRAFT_1465156 [Lactifluus volemus]
MLTYLDNLLGAFLIGVILSSIFYGFTWLQVYLYYTQHSSRDRIFLKCFVAVLTALDSFHLVLLCHGLYVVLITNFGNIAADLHAPWSLVAQCIVGGASTDIFLFSLKNNIDTHPFPSLHNYMHSAVLTATFVRFYAVRIYQLSERKNVFIPLAIVRVDFPYSEHDLTRIIFSAYYLLQNSVRSLFMVAVIWFYGSKPALGIVFAAKSYKIGSFTANTPSVPYGASSLALEVFCGVFITVGMVYYILQQRSGLESSNRVLNLVILYIVNSGALNLIFATACLATYLIFPKTLIYAPFFFILIRLYPCSFLTMYVKDLFNRFHERLFIVVVNRLNSRVNISNGSPLTTFKPNQDSNSDMSLVDRTRRRTAEKAVGMDEAVD